MDIIRLGMMKNRYGPRGTTQAMRVDYHTLSISQTEDDIDDDSDDEVFRSLQSFGT